MRSFLLSGLLSLAITGFAQANETSTVYDFDGSFEDATFSVESAIVGKGLVIDYVSHTGEMLNRTGDDVGSKVKLFDEADTRYGYLAYLYQYYLQIYRSHLER